MKSIVRENQAQQVQIPSDQQLHMFAPQPLLRRPPSTRYQGSKKKLLPWIWQNIAEIPFTTALDAFAGTGSVSYMLKTQGKTVTCNDYMQSNYMTCAAIIENSHVVLSEQEVDFLLVRDSSVQYDNVIERTFQDIYYTDEENRWLDVVCQNISRIQDKYKRALAYHALFQACMIKRPYNLFHRKNLYMRTADVKRGFGNKSTWDTPFEEHFRRFAKEANQAVFDSGGPCQALCFDAVELPGEFDLVYIDTPYLNSRGVGVDYLEFYHFLEGMTDYKNWLERIDYGKKHRPLKVDKSPWCDPKQIAGAFERLFERYRCSILVVSYRSDGIPSEEELLALVRKFKTRVCVFYQDDYKYVLSANGNSKEVLLVAH